MQTSALQTLKKTTVKELNRLQKKQNAVFYELNKLNNDVTNAKMLLKKTRYQLLHPVISQLIDIFRLEIINICTSYLLFDFCEQCNKSYPAVVSACWKCNNSSGHSLFGDASLSSDGTMYFGDPRDYEIWFYFSGSGLFVPNLVVATPIEETEVAYYWAISWDWYGVRKTSVSKTSHNEYTTTYPYIIANPQDPTRWKKNFF